MKQKKKSAIYCGKITEEKTVEEDNNRYRNKERKEQRKEETMNAKEIKGGRELFCLLHLHRKEIMIGRFWSKMKIRIGRRKLNKVLSYLNRPMMMRIETSRIMIVRT